jgi:hypothetical protein
MGHINPDSEFGEILFRLASDTKFSTYLEVGSWNGQGTTRCLMMGILLNNPTAKLYSLEANDEMYARSVSYWNNEHPQLHLINGTLHKNLIPLHIVEAHPMFYKCSPQDQKYKDRYRDEFTTVMNAKLFPVPEETIDVIVIDGGEYSGEGDWSVLKTKNPKVVCLDDSQVVKNFNTRKELLASPEWKVLTDSPDDRNGVTVFQRIDTH